MADKITRYRPYETESKDPLADLLKSQYYDPNDFREQDFRHRLDRMNQRERLLERRSRSLANPPPEEAFRTAAAERVARSFMARNISPTEDVFWEAADREFAASQVKLNERTKTLALETEEAVKGGMLTDQDDLLGTPEQRKAIKDNDIWYLNENQAKHRVLRHWARAGLYPPSEYDKILSQSMEEIQKDESIRSGLKADLKRTFEQPRQGPLSQREDFVDETWLQWFGGTLPMKAITAPAEGIAAMTAKNIEHLYGNTSIREDMLSQAKVPTPDEIYAIDDKSVARMGLLGPSERELREWGRTFGVADPETGKMIPYSKQVGWHGTRGPMPAPKIDSVTGHPVKKKRRNQPYMNLATGVKWRSENGSSLVDNPKYVEEKEYRDTHPQPSLTEVGPRYRWDGTAEGRYIPTKEELKPLPDRPFGVSRETYDAYPELGAKETFSALWDGLTHEELRPKIVEELMRFKEHLMEVSDKALDMLPSDDPRRGRYYGADIEERQKLAVDLTIKQLGKPVTKEEYEKVFKGLYSKASWSLAEYQRDPRARRLPGRMVRTGSAQEVTDRQHELAIEKLQGRSNIDKFKERMNYNYKNYPRLKMVEDQLGLMSTGSWVIGNPQAFDLLHKIILDPLWIVGPVKIAKTIKTGYGITKQFGQYGKLARQFSKEEAARKGLLTYSEHMLGQTARGQKGLYPAVPKALESVVRSPAKMKALEAVGAVAEPISAFAQKAGKAGTATKELVVTGAKRVTPEFIKKPLGGMARGTYTGYQWISGAFRHFTKVDKDYANIGALKEDIAMMSRVAADAGTGASNKLRSLGDDMLTQLDRAASPEQQSALHLLLSGTFRNLYKESAETGVAVLNPNKAGEAMQSLIRAGEKGELDKFTAAEQLTIMTDEAVRNGYLSSSLKDVPETVRKLSDDFFDLAKESGQLSRVEEGILKHAQYVNGYIPRWMKATERIHDDLVRLVDKNGKAVFKDVGDAAYKIAPKGMWRLIAKIQPKGASQTFEAAVETVRKNVSKDVNFTEALADALKPDLYTAAKRKDVELFESVLEHRKQIINNVAGGDAVKARTIFNDIREIKRALDAPDYLGQVTLTRKIAPVADPRVFTVKALKEEGKEVLRKMTGRAAKERMPAGDKYYWLENPLKQFEAYIKDISTRAAVSGEIKELGRAFGVDNVSSILGGPSMINVSGHGITSKGAKRFEEIESIAETLTANRGIQMVPLSPGMSKEVGKVLLEEGAKLTDDAVVFVPQVVANRLTNLIHITPVNHHDKVYKGLNAFRDYAVRPLNSTYRMTRTVLRSPAFHTVNYFGAVGLGVLGLGVRAANPQLQRGAYSLAVSAAFGGSDVARAMEMVLPASAVGQKIKIGDALQIMVDYGYLNQGMMKYGLDISRGKGLLAIPANALGDFAKGIRAQQVAEFSDNYQKAVLFLGNLKSTKRADIYRTLDFVSEYGQNYNRLTPFEKTVMRDTFTFYSWNRFILPHLARQIYKNPARLAAFEKMKDVIEYNNKHRGPFTGMGVPSFLRLQGAFTSPESMQPGYREERYFAPGGPKPGEPASHEFGMGVIELPFTSLSALGGGFRGESPLHAQVGPVPRIIMSMLSGFDYGTGHAWEKDLVVPTMENFTSMDAAKEYLFNFNDSRVGREVIDTLPMGGAFTNLIKLYTRAGQHPEAVELYMRYRAGRDFLGLDNLIASMFGAKGLSLAPTMSLGPLKLPAPWERHYPVDSTKVQQKRIREFRKYNRGRPGLFTSGGPFLAP